MKKPTPTRAEQIAKLRAKAERNNGASPFCVAFSRNTPGINTEPVQDRDKTQQLRRASI
jgi:hypothetical protein